VSIFRNVLKGVFPTYGAQSYTLGHDKLLHVLEGRRGKGKSYTVADLVYRMAAQRVRIVTNVGSTDFYRLALLLVRDGHFRSLAEALEWFSSNVTLARSWDDVLLAYDSVIIFDEATRLFDARKGMGAGVPTLMFEWLRQSRKVRCTVYFIAQSMEWLDVRIRQLVDMFWQVRKEVGRDGARAPDGTPLPVGFWLYGLDPGGVGRVDEVNRHVADFISRVPFRLRIAQSYHSWELIAEIAGAPTVDTMSDIRRLHEEGGRSFGVDSVELLAEHCRRLSAPAAAGSPAPDGPARPGALARARRAARDLFAPRSPSPVGGAD
jgi:hypothetical protein